MSNLVDVSRFESIEGSDGVVQDGDGLCQIVLALFLHLGTTVRVLLASAVCAPT